MADRYWRGTTSNDWHNTGNWSTTSGGATGASIPTSSDNAIFNGSGNTICTVTAAASCNNLTIASGYTANFTHNNPITISGSLSIHSGASMKGNAVTGYYTFDSTSTGNTITTNGVTIHTIYLNGSGGEWTLGSALSIDTSWSGLVLTNGSFVSAGYAITCLDITVNAGTKSLNLGSSTVTLSRTGTLSPVDFETNSTGLTLSVSSAKFVLTGAVLDAKFGSSTTIADLTSTSLTGTFALTLGTISGTFNIGPSASGQRYAALSLRSNLTVNTLFTSNTSIDHDTRLHIRSSVKGTQRTLSIGTFGFFGTPSRNIDWEDINVTGAASPLPSGTHHGDGGNCAGIQARTPTTYYGVSAGNFSSSSSWASSSGGSGGVGVPILHDTIVLDASSGAGTYTVNVPRLGNLDCTAFTGTLANSGTVEVWFYGDCLFPASGFTWNFASTGALRFRPVTSGKYISFNGNGTTKTIYIEAAPGTSIEITSSVNLTGILYLSSGTLEAADGNLGGWQIECNGFFATGSTTRVIDITNTAIWLNGTGYVLDASGSNLTVSGSSADIWVKNTSAATKTIVTGGHSFNGDITFGNADSGNCLYNFAGGGTFQNLIMNKTGPCTLQMVFFVPWYFSGISGNGSAGNLITWKSSLAGALVAMQFTGDSPQVLEYWDVKDVRVGRDGSYTAHSNLLHVWNGVDSGNTQNIRFMPRDIYLGALPLLGVGA